MKKNNTIVIALSIIIAGAIIAVAVIVASGLRGTTPTPAQPTTNPTESNANSGEGGLGIGDAPVLGDANAPVTIVEFGDFQCPYCNQFFIGAEKQIIDTYVKTGKAKFVFKPLTFVDSSDGNAEPRESYLSASAATCAQEQGAFWDMYDLIYQTEANEVAKGISSENNGNLTMSFFTNAAKQMGLDANQFSSCVTSDKYASQIATYSNDAQLAMPEGISTPAVFINGQKVTGARDFSVYKNIIDSILAQQ